MTTFRHAPELIMNFSFCPMIIFHKENERVPDTRSELPIQCDSAAVLQIRRGNKADLGRIFYILENSP